MENNLDNNKKRTGPVLFSKYTRGEGIKKALAMPREDVLFELKSSGLKGRGGAGFPTSTKWMLVAASTASKKFIVCNADEGEPGTFKDRVLLMEYPELVFDGMVIAGYTIGAKTGIVYLRGEYEYLLLQLEEYLMKMKTITFSVKIFLAKRVLISISASDSAQVPTFVAKKLLLLNLLKDIEASQETVPHIRLIQVILASPQ